MQGHLESKLPDSSQPDVIKNIAISFLTLTITCKHILTNFFSFAAPLKC